MARQAAARRAAQPTACRCRHLKFHLLDPRVTKAIGELPGYTTEGFCRKYEVSPCEGFPLYFDVAQSMCIPIPGHNVGVFEEDSSSEEESEDEESDTVVQVNDSVSHPGWNSSPLDALFSAAVCRVQSTNESSTGRFSSPLAAFSALGATSDGDTDAVVPPPFSTNETSKKRTAAVMANVATAATASSNKRTRRPDMDHRPAWVARAEREREKLLSSSSAEKATTPSPIMSWGKPQSTASRPLGKPSSNEWTYRTFSSNQW
jgi:hypothetical protein